MLPQKMKAAVLFGKNDLRVCDWPVPALAPDGLLVKVEASGVCGSDIPRVLQGTAHAFPIVLGHEFCGRIVAVGKDVVGFSVGQRVSGAPLLPCGDAACPACSTGHYGQCTHYSFIGSRIDGAWAEYVALPARNAVLLGEEMDAVAGALLEPVSVALHGIYGMGYHGEAVAVVGLGAIGLLTAQCLQTWGGNVYGSDIRSEALEAANAFGVRTVEEGMTFPAVLETAGTQGAFERCLQLAAPGGRIMLIGTPTRAVTYEVKTWEIINRKELTIQGSWMSYSAPFPGKEWTQGAQLLSEGRIKNNGVVCWETDLDGLPKTFAFIEKGRAGKVMIRLDTEG